MISAFTKCLRYALFTIGIICSFSVNAQLIQLQGGDSAFAGRYEIGLAMYSSDYREAGIYSNDTLPFRGNYFVNGLYFRFWNNGNAYRFCLNHYADEDGLGQYYSDPSLNSFEGTLMRPSFSGIIRNAVEVKGGAQILLFNSRLSPYFTADLGYRYTVEKSYLTFIDNGSGKPQTVTQLFTDGSSRVALYGGFGMKYQLTERWVLGFETQISLYYSWVSSNMPGRLPFRGVGRGLHPGQFTLGLYL